MIRKRKKYIIIGSILVLLVIFRLVLPAIVLKYTNKVLAGMDGYYGHIRDIDISLYRGAYQLDSIYINKVDSASGKQTEFFNASKVDLSLEWKALFQGAITGELEFFSPKLVFTKDKTELGQVAKDTNDFRKVLKSLMPLKINRFEIHNGSIHYVDRTTSPKVDISLKETYVLAQNLKNTSDNKEKLPSTVTARAQAYEGSLSLKMKLDALAKEPSFDLEAEIKDANLVLLNDFFKAYGKFDVSKGTMGLYTEFAAEDGKFKGYVKPLIKNLKVLGIEDRDDNVFQKLKEGIVHAAGAILKNPKEQQVATKVPIEGSFKNPGVNNWEAVWEILRNAFIEALMPSIDHEIDIRSAEEVEPEKKKGFFQRLFSKKEKNKEKKTGLDKYSTKD